LDKDYFNVLILGQKTSKTRHLRIRKKTFKVGLYLLSFGVLVTILSLRLYPGQKKNLRTESAATADAGTQIEDSFFRIRLGRSPKKLFFKQAEKALEAVVASDGILWG